MHASIVFWLVAILLFLEWPIPDYFQRIDYISWQFRWVLVLIVERECKYLLFKILLSFFSYFYAVISKTTWYVVDHIGCVVVKWLHSLRVTRVFLASSFWFPFPDYHLSSTFSYRLNETANMDNNVLSFKKDVLLIASTKLARHVVW